MQKVKRALLPQTSHSRRVAPRRTRKTGSRASRTTPAIENRRATPVSGGMPRRPTRIAAHVVPQIRTSAASDAQVRKRDGFSLRP
jgi:hypothetical protein